MITLRTRCGILMSMIMIVMSIWVGIGWIIVALQDISIWCWCRQRMISFKIKFVFVVMRFDLLLMLIINLTVFFIISVCGRRRWEENDMERKRKKREERMWISVFSWEILRHTNTSIKLKFNVYMKNRFFNADGTFSFLHSFWYFFLFHFSRTFMCVYIFNLPISSNG